jgi:hypothetical protein
LAATTDRQLAISQESKPHDRGTEAHSIAYYEDQAEPFFAETVDVDMALLYARFLDHIPPDGRSLRGVAQSGAPGVGPLRYSGRGAAL